MGEVLDRLLTVTEAAQIMSMHPQTVRKAIREGEISVYRFSRSIRITESAISEYLNRYLCPAKDQRNHSSNSTERNGASYGLMKTESAKEALQAARMRSALDAL
ncbi:helix-turn-helix domain-containing protein [Acetobacter thailandicus]|nr:helix-turn-helix domain-containing protein [Acetobacter thailandicus]